MWEAEERIAELEARQSEQLERERVLEVEIAALRRDVDVEVACTRMLRRRRPRSGTATSSGCNRILTRRRQHAERLSAELSAERARLSYRVVRRIVLILKLSRGGP